MRKLLFITLVSIAFLMTAVPEGEAQMARCWWCGSDQLFTEFKGASSKAIREEESVVDCAESAAIGTEVLVLCLGPQSQFVAPGKAAAKTAISVSESVNAAFCDGKEKGTCVVPVDIPTQVHDFGQLLDDNDPLIHGICNPVTDTPQSCFEKFWGIPNDACNSKWTPVAVFISRTISACNVYEFGKLKRSFQAVCSYPKANPDLHPVFGDCVQQ